MADLPSIDVLQPILLAWQEPVLARLALVRAELQAMQRHEKLVPGQAQRYLADASSCEKAISALISELTIEHFRLRHTLHELGRPVAMLRTVAQLLERDTSLHLVRSRRTDYLASVTEEIANYRDSLRTIVYNEIGSQPSDFYEAVLRHVVRFLSLLTTRPVVDIDPQVLGARKIMIPALLVRCACLRLLLEADGGSVRCQAQDNGVASFEFSGWRAKDLDSVRSTPMTRMLHAAGVVIGDGGFTVKEQRELA